MSEKKKLKEPDFSDLLGFSAIAACAVSLIEHFRGKKDGGGNNDF